MSESGRAILDAYWGGPWDGMSLHLRTLFEWPPVIPVPECRGAYCFECEDECWIPGEPELYVYCWHQEGLK